MSTVTFTFDGKQYSGEKGESLASALLRNGVLHFTDSSYKDRPRGVMGLWVEETNALVNVDSGAGEPLKPATTIEIVEGLVVRSAQGVGDLPDTRDNSRYDKANRHVDVLVVGAGTSGLESAKKFSDQGKSVIVMDDKPTAGGHLVYLGQPVPAELLAVLERENVTYLPRTTVQGLYDQGYSVATERRTDHLDVKVHTEMSRIRTWHIRAEHTVLATGAFQRHLVFANNDRPGIMLSHAAATYVSNGANPFKTAVVVTVDNQGYRDAIRLHKAGVHVAAVVDIRKKVSKSSKKSSRKAIEKLGIRLIKGATVIDTQANLDGLLSSVTIVDAKSDLQETIKTDLLAVSGGWTPIVHLATFIGIKPTWSAKRAAFIVKHKDSLTSTAGMLAGDFGDDDEAAIFFGPKLSTEQALVAFVDYQRDATYRDFKRAIDAGMRSIEHVKRYTAIGTAHDQGKTSGTVTMGLIGQAIGKAPDEIGSLTFRPPYISIPFAALAGRDRGLLSDPERTTPIHAWHVASGAPMEDVGQWKRPWYFPMPGESMHAAVLRECAAVREDVGVMDASTLGKIDIQGKDAGEFLDLIYTNMFSTLKVGMSRYGLMCGIDGMVFDDGVTTRISENHWLMTTTTGGAAKVLDWLEEWLQTEWPHLEVYCTSVTEQISTVAIVGPKSRELMSRLAPSLDVSNEAFAFMENKHSDVAGVSARIARISFSGELAYEINVPAIYGLHIWESVMAKGADLNITPYGTETMHVLRAEKGFVIVGQETDGTQTPDDLDMNWIVSKKKDDFIGKRSFSRADTARDGRHQLVGILGDDGSYVIPEGAYIVAGADANTAPPVKHIGYITSSYDSAALGRSFALALVANGLARKGEKIAIPMADRVVTGVITDSVFVDKENTRRDG
jgi:sarcosine oxidase subunit alpha